MEDKYKGLDRRGGVRLSRKLIAKFMLVNEETAEELTGLEMGSVLNISAGGALLEVETLKEEWIEGLISGVIKVALDIEVPTSNDPVRALSRAVWFSKINASKEKGKDRYILGLRFLDITTACQDIIRDYIIKTYIK